MDMEKIIKKLYDARKYLEDKEWSDSNASPHINTIIDAITMLKQQQNYIEKLEADKRWDEYPDMMGKW